MHPVDPNYLLRLAGLHRELGIPVDYAARRGLTPQPEANEAALITIADSPDGRSVRLTAPAAAAWRELHAAARDDGIALLPQSGFRSVARQAEIIRGKLAAGRTMAEILTTIAAPGYSEHHTGRALDLGTPEETELEEAFADTPAFTWLQAKAGQHGFRLSFPRGNSQGFVYEPWHWCWRPESSAGL